MTRLFIALASLPLLCGCAAGTAGEDGDLRLREPDGACDASGVQDHIGHRASAAAGSTLLQLTRARVLRWIPPRTAVTMDYRADRLNVSYDDHMIIERIACGWPQ